MSRTTITVSSSSAEIWKKLKARFKAKSSDALMLILANVQPFVEEDVLSSSGASDESEPPQKKRRKNVREPLFSFEELAERHEMLKYYTGLDKAAIDLLVKRLEEVE
jgi:hypothetical protein